MFNCERFIIKKKKKHFVIPQDSIPWASAEDIRMTRIECRISHLEEMLTTVLDLLKREINVIV